MNTTTTPTTTEVIAAENIRAAADTLTLLHEVARKRITNAIPGELGRSIAADPSLWALVAINPEPVGFDELFDAGLVTWAADGAPEVTV